jgi:hypothetical protein
MRRKRELYGVNDREDWTDSPQEHKKKKMGSRVFQWIIGCDWTDSSTAGMVELDDVNDPCRGREV